MINFPRILAIFYYSRDTKKKTGWQPTWQQEISKKYNEKHFLTKQSKINWIFHKDSPPASPHPHRASTLRQQWREKILAENNSTAWEVNHLCRWLGWLDDWLFGWQYCCYGYSKAAAAQGLEELGNGGQSTVDDWGGFWWPTQNFREFWCFLSQYFAPFIKLSGEFFNVFLSRLRSSKTKDKWKEIEANHYDWGEGGSRAEGLKKTCLGM